MTSVRQAQITNRRTIADTFVRLARGVDEVTLRLQTSRIRYPVSVVSVDRAVGQCRLDIAGLDDIDAALREHQPFALRIRQATGTIVTSPMQTRGVETGNHNDLKLRCTLPDALTLSRRRSDFRAVLTKTMHVNVTLRIHAGAEYACRLCNLSVGGCLVSLDDSTAFDTNARDGSCRVQIRFPGGDVLEAEGYVRRVHRLPGSSLSYVGVRFEADFDDKPRGLWFYVCEIEREAVRQTHGREGLRALMPSRLFDDGQQARSQPESVSCAR